MSRKLRAALVIRSGDDVGVYQGSILAHGTEVLPVEVDGGTGATKPERVRIYIEVEPPGLVWTKIEEKR